MDIERRTRTGEVAPTATLRLLRDQLAVLDPHPIGGDAERIDQLRLLEEIKAAAAAAQMRVAVDFDASQRQTQRTSGLREKKVGAGIADQIALAVRQSPARARRFLGLAKVVIAEMPRTFDELAAGRSTETRVLSVARETLFLDRADRELVDRVLAPRLERLGDRATEDEARKLAQRLDPAGAVERASNAISDRHVTIRPAPDTMVRLSALLPVAAGVSAYAALSQAAESARARGDERGRGQVMADTLVERVTGRERAEDVSAEIQLVMTPDTLFNTRGPDDVPDEPAHCVGYGSIPADLARRILADSTGAVFVRRLWSTPDRSRFLGVETHRTSFDGTLRKLLIARDQRCRNLYCGAAIRHVDHPFPRRSGGQTTAETGQGLCEACNYAKEAPGWRARPGPGGAGADVITRTPTGHTYVSVPPRPPGAQPFTDDPSPWERALTRLLARRPTGEAHSTGRPSPRAMSIRCTSEVPSPISSTLASR